MLLLLIACKPVDPQVEPPPLLDRYDLDSGVDHPEGLAFDAGVQAFFVGSLGNGGITQVSISGGETRLYTPEEDGWSSLGMKVEGGQLFTCAVQFPGTPDAVSALWVTDLEGSSTRVIPLADPPNNCNDVAIDGNDAYLTDRESNRIHHVSLADGLADIWLEHAELTPGLIGNNGIVLTDDGALLVGQYSPPRLLRVPLADPSALTVVDLEGAAFGTLPGGADGIAWDGDELVVAANRRLVRVATADNWTSATASFTELDFGIAAVTVAQGRLYGLKGEVVAFVLGTPVELPFAIIALD